MKIRALRAIGLIASLTVVSGAMHGWITDRWREPADMLAAAAKLKEIPDQFGNWQLESSHEIDEDALTVLECAGYVHRTYINHETDHGVRVSVVCGPPGPTSVHTPEICYDSQGQNIKQGPLQVILQDSDGTDHKFWSIVLEANNVDRGNMVVYYAWSAGDVWVAPKNPRVSLSKHAYLFKLQLAAPVVAEWDLRISDPCPAFLRDFIPVAKRCMTSGE